MVRDLKAPADFASVLIDYTRTPGVLRALSASVSRVDVCSLLA